jgi:hypothetical protein
VTDAFDDIIDGYRKLFPKPPLAEPTAPATLAAKPKRGRGREQFIIVPMTWKDCLTKAVHASTFKLALHLLYQHWKTDGAAIKLSNTTLDGMSGKQKWRGLRELEKLGLVAVERRKRRSPLVRVVKAAGNHGT